MAIIVYFILIFLVIGIIVYNRTFYRGGPGEYSEYMDEEDVDFSPYDRDKLKPINSKLPPPKDGSIKEGIVFYKYSGRNYLVCPKCESENETSEKMCCICGNRFRL